MAAAGRSRERELLSGWYGCVQGKTGVPAASICSYEKAGECAPAGMDAVCEGALGHLYDSSPLLP